MSAIIPAHELSDFARLPEEARAEVRRKLAVMQRLQSLRKGIGAAIAEQASILGMSAKTLRKHYDQFEKSGSNWRTLVDRRRFPEVDGDSGVPQSVIQLWQKLCEQNNRKCKPAYRAFLDCWRRGQPEGIDWPECNPGTETPKGCTYRNMMRFRPDDFSLTAMRNGLGAAMAAHGPQVLTTRVGLWVGSHYLIDDVLRDMELMLLGKGGQIVRPQELGVLDLFSADRFAVHRRPLYRREDGTKDGVKEKEMRFLAASVFRNVGYSPRGTEIVAELGTAAIRAPMATWLHEHSRGLITVRGPGITGREQALGGYWGRGGGNPRHKAALESHHNLLHNEAANLPAATGHDRNPPEWLHGLQAITNQVLEWIRNSPPERAALFRVPHLEYWQGLALLAEIDQRIAWRDDHEIEGWIECGHTVVEYRRDILSDRWIGPEEFLALPPSDQQILADVARSHPAFRRPRKLAPREVFSKGAQDLVKISDAEIALLFCDRNLGDDLRLSRPKQLTADGDLSLQDITVEPEAMFFGREIITPDGGSLRLQERTDYTVALNPFDREILWIYDTRAAYLGAAPRRHRASPIVLEQIQQQLGHRSHEKAALLAPLAERHADAAEMIRTMQEENEAVASGSSLTEMREAQRNAGQVSDFLPPNSDRSEDASFSDFLPKS